MLKKTVVIMAAATLFGEGLTTQSVHARDYYHDDDIWDLMNPSWWADEFFDDDDDWWYYQHRYHNRYWGPPIRQHPQVIVIMPEQESIIQDTETKAPE